MSSPDCMSQRHGPQLNRWSSVFEKTARHSPGCGMTCCWNRVEVPQRRATIGSRMGLKPPVELRTAGNGHPRT